MDNFAAIFKNHPVANAYDFGVLAAREARKWFWANEIVKLRALAKKYRFVKRRKRRKL